MKDNFDKIKRISIREFRMIWSDSRIRSVVLFAPFIYASLFCVVYIKHSLSELPIAVLQSDFSAPTRALVNMIEASPKLAITHQVQSVAEIEDLMLKGEIDGAITFPHDFSLELKQGHDSTVTAFVNASSMVAANMVGKAFNEVVQTFSAGVELKTLMKKGVRLDEAKEQFMPIKLDLRSMYNPAFNYSNFMIPGLLMSILQQVILLGVALSWTGEKEAKTLKEVIQISDNPVVLMLGKALPYFLINLLVAEFYLRVVFPLNDIPMEGSWFIAISFTMLFIATIVTWGQWMSALCRTRLFATQALMFVAMPSFVLSGFTWPARGMPDFVQWISKLLPLTHFVNSFRGVYLAAAPWRYVRGEFLMLSLFLVVNIFLCIKLISRAVVAEGK
jgi:ABC-2 type transport system permease protein